MSPPVRPRPSPFGNDSVAERGLPGVAKTLQPPPSRTISVVELAVAPPGLQKQMIGNKLRPAIARIQPTMADKLIAILLV